MANNEEKKRKRIPAAKTNTCLKWHHLARTATALNLEELGLLYFMLQVTDDEKNIRYDLISDDYTKDLFKQKEEEYFKLFKEKMKTNALFRVLFEEHAGQIKSSRKYYNSLVTRLKEHNDSIDNDEDTTTATETQTTETAQTTNTSGMDFYIDEEKEKVSYYIDIDEYLKSLGRNKYEVTKYIIKNKDKYNLPLGGCYIDDVLMDMDNEKTN